MKISSAAERDPLAVGIGDGGGTAEVEVLHVPMVPMAAHVLYMRKRKE